MKVKGTLEYRDIEGGVWLLKGDDGKRYTLLGRIDAKPGATVEVDGILDDSGFGIAMSGPQLKVSRVKPL